jgi:hypothetical protein
MTIHVSRDFQGWYGMVKKDGQVIYSVLYLHSESAVRCRIALWIERNG